MSTKLIKPQRGLNTANILINVVCIIIFLIFIGAIFMLFSSVFKPAKEYDIYTYINFKALPTVDFSLFNNVEDIKLYTVLSNVYNLILLTPLLITTYFAKKTAFNVCSGEIFCLHTSNNILFIAISCSVSMIFEANHIAFFSLLFAKPFLSHLVYGASAPLSVFKSQAFTFDVYSLVIISVLILVYYAFKHGEKLQKLSDETL